MKKEPRIIGLRDALGFNWGLHLLNPARWRNGGRRRRDALPDRGTPGGLGVHEHRVLGYARR